jgi:hypothetical protein
MLHQTPAQDGHTFDVPDSQINAVPFLLRIPEDVFDSIVDIAHDNTQSVEETILATPVFVAMDTKSLDFIYYPTGKSVSQVLGPVKSVRLEVIR